MMQTSLLQQLQHYQPVDAHEELMTERLQRFLTSVAPQNPFERDLAGAAPEHGHVTGSAWVIDPNYSQCVLLYHAKLRKWVQPGGHCDGDADVRHVAQREASEETSLLVTPIQEGIFDIDIHEIPEYWNTPAHFHFDVRYLFTADPAQPLVSNHESRAVRWLPLEDVDQFSQEESVLRMVRKTRLQESTFT